MGSKVKDVEFALFAQLSYLDWDSLDIERVKDTNEYKNKDFIGFINSDQVWSKIQMKSYPTEGKVKNGVYIYEEEDKRLFGVYGVERIKGSEHLKPLYDFKGWQFIYSANKTKLYKDYFNEDVKDNGFFACAFMKDDEIVVAFRGTEFMPIYYENTINKIKESKKKELEAEKKITKEQANEQVEKKYKNIIDVSIGKDSFNDVIEDMRIYNYRKISEQLMCAYFFMEYLEERYIGKNFNITGHSLGGALAQYAFVMTGKKYPTVTWNGLGIGEGRGEVGKDLLYGNEIQKILSTEEIALVSDIKKRYLGEEEQTKDNKAEANNPISNDIHLKSQFIDMNINDKSSYNLMKSLYNNKRFVIDEIKNMIVQSKYMSIITGTYNILTVELGENFLFKIGMSSSVKKEDRAKYDESQRKDIYKELANDKKILKKAEDVYRLLTLLKKYREFEKESDEKIKNYYIYKDWVPALDEQIGDRIEVLTGEAKSPLKEDESLKQGIFVRECLKLLDITNDFLNKIPQALFITIIKILENKSLSLFACHGVNNFLLFMDNKGNIVPGEINPHFLYNAVKTGYINLDSKMKSKLGVAKLQFCGQNGNCDTKRKKTNSPFNEELVKLLLFKVSEKESIFEKYGKFKFEEITKSLDSEKEIRRYTPKPITEPLKGASTKEIIRDGMKIRKKETKTTWKLGGLDNVDILCGIIGGELKIIEEYGEQEEKEKIKIDHPSKTTDENRTRKRRDNTILSGGTDIESY